MEQRNSSGVGPAGVVASELVPGADLERLKRFLEHWLEHNQGHVDNFRVWAQRARAMGLGEVGEVIEGIAQETLLQKEKIERALHLLQLERGAH